MYGKLLFPVTGCAKGLTMEGSTGIRQTTVSPAVLENSWHGSGSLRRCRGNTTHTHAHTHTQAALWALPPSLNNIHSPFLTYLKVTQHCSKVLQFFSFTYKQLLQKLYKNCNKILLYSWESITSLLREGWRIGEWEATLAFSSEKFVLICMRWEIGTLLFITVNILFNYVLVIPKDTGRYFSAYFLMFEFYVEIRGHLI